jgi:hypothetical protein
MTLFHTSDREIRNPDIHTEGKMRILAGVFISRRTRILSIGGRVKMPW